MHRAMVVATNDKRIRSETRAPDGTFPLTRYRHVQPPQPREIILIPMRHIESIERSNTSIRLIHLLVRFFF